MGRVERGAKALLGIRRLPLSQRRGAAGSSAAQPQFPDPRLPPTRTHKGCPGVHGRTRSHPRRCAHTRTTAQRRAHPPIHTNTLLTGPRTAVHPHLHTGVRTRPPRCERGARTRVDPRPQQRALGLEASHRLPGLCWEARAHADTHTETGTRAHTRTAPRPWPLPGSCVARLAAGGRGPGAGAAAAAGRAKEAERGARSGLASAPPAGRGFSRLGADAADLPAATADHGRQRDSVSAGGHPAPRAWGRARREHGRGLQPAFAVTRGPGTRLSTAGLLCGRWQKLGGGGT